MIAKLRALPGKVEPWFRDGFLYACLIIFCITVFANLATAYARAFLGDVR